MNYFWNILCSIYGNDEHVKNSRIILTGAVASFSFFKYFKWYTYKLERRNRRKLIKNSSINIGAIFGLDVGGTLAKLIYFEKDTNGNTANSGAITEPLSYYKVNTRPITPIIDSSNHCDSFARLDSPDHEAALINMHSSIMNMDTTIMLRDDALSFYCPQLGMYWLTLLNTC